MKDMVAMMLLASRSALPLVALASAVIVAVLTIASVAAAGDSDKVAAVGPPLVLRLYAAPGYPAIPATERKPAARPSAKANAAKALAPDQAGPTLVSLLPPVR
jgi:hypothetical protein